MEIGEVKMNRMLVLFSLSPVSSPTLLKVTLQEVCQMVLKLCVYRRDTHTHAHTHFVHLNSKHFL